MQTERQTSNRQPPAANPQTEAAFYIDNKTAVLVDTLLYLVA